MSVPDTARRPLDRRRRWLLRLLGLYPPFLGAGIRVRRIPGGFESSMRLHAWNRNFVGTHFGGSLYAMTDPFYVLLLYERLGRGYTIWNLASTIHFERPGRGRVFARCVLEEPVARALERDAADGSRLEPVFRVAVVDAAGETVALVEQTLYLRRNPSPATPSSTGA